MLVSVGNQDSSNRKSDADVLLKKLAKQTNQPEYVNLSWNSQYGLNNQTEKRAYLSKEETNERENQYLKEN